LQFAPDSQLHLQPPAIKPPKITMSSAVVDPLGYTTPLQITKTIRRDPYPALEPTSAKLSQKGKIVVITGAYGGLGEVCPAADLSISIGLSSN